MLRFARIVLVPLFVLQAVLLATHATSSAAQDVPVRADGVYSAKTRHSLAEPFWGFWVQHDGPNQFGLPISEALPYGSEQIQYFEFGAIRTRDETVERIKVGSVLKQREEHASNATPQSSPVSASPVAAPTMSADEKKLREGIATAIDDYIEHHGGHVAFGKPLGDLQLDGEVAVQWFEYAHLSISKGATHKVIRAQLGTQLATARNVDTERVDRHGLPTLDLERPGQNYYVGDGTVPEAAAAFEPARVMIPSIELDGAIEQTGIIDGVMGVPEDPWKVGWYYQLDSPGLRGNAVMAGHVDWWGIGPTIFYSLSSVQLGATIYVLDEEGEGATYLVSEIGSVDADTNAADIVGSTDPATLTLITCTGTFNGVEYTSRLIVKALRF